ncbi:hypothetical protein [Streptomyces sp. NBC_00467]|uniref:hypothetical protein n=1 Tax=Streptomyces sp. NBC_00467 TaxID=2975752 RepID=UPI002E191C86
MVPAQNVTECGLSSGGRKAGGRQNACGRGEFSVIEHPARTGNPRPLPASRLRPALGPECGEWEIPCIPLQYERAVLAGAVAREKLHATATALPEPGFRLLLVALGVGDRGREQSDRSACWWATTSCARPARRST